MKKTFDDYLYSTIERYVVPPANNVHIVLEHSSNGVYYTCIEDLDLQTRLWVHRPGSSQGHGSSHIKALSKAKLLWSYECEVSP